MAERSSLLVARICEICEEPCDDREAWAVGIDGGTAHHSCLRFYGVCGTLIDSRENRDRRAGATSETRKGD